MGNSKPRRPARAKRIYLGTGVVPREAQAAINEALKLGTLDARLLYHAGIIARARGDTAAATDYLQRALVLNPDFDPLQSQIARETLKDSASR